MLLAQQIQFHNVLPVEYLFLTLNNLLGPELCAVYSNKKKWKCGVSEQRDVKLSLSNALLCALSLKWLLQSENNCIVLE